jgi:hypothetical protein
MSVIEMTENKMTENEMIAKVARTLLVLENHEELYHCDFLADCVLKLHGSLNAIVPVLKCTGAIDIIDLNHLNGAIRDLHSVLHSSFLTDEIYTVSESSTGYGRLEDCLIDLIKTCKFMEVSDWDDNNPDNNEMRSAAMRCVSSLQDCVTYIKDVCLGRQIFAQDVRSYYSRRRAGLVRLLGVFEEHVE